MIRDLIERFKYRLELWHREQRAERWGGDGTVRPECPTPRVFRESESISKMLIMSIGIYLCIIILLARICQLIGLFIPPARFLMFVVFVVVAGFWTFCMLLGTVTEYKAKKALEAAKKSSNQAI